MAEPVTGPVRVLTEGEFLEALRLEFADEIDPERFTLDAKVGRDLELDSLQLLRLYAFVESFAPITLPEQLDPWEATLADLHHYYATLAGRAGSNGA